MATADLKRPGVADGDVARLRERFRGPLLRPADPGYDEARVIWNAMIDRRPALIARCTGVADVVAAVCFAREGGYSPAIRGGGHGAAGYAMADDELVIDLSLMKGVRVDPRARRVRAEGGCNWVTSTTRRRPSVSPCRAAPSPTRASQASRSGAGSAG